MKPKSTKYPASSAKPSKSLSKHAAPPQKPAESDPSEDEAEDDFEGFDVEENEAQNGANKRDTTMKGAVDLDESDEEETEVHNEGIASDGAKKSFADLGIIESLCEACESMGFKHPTPIQEQAIPVALEGRDVIGLAETGSGKTASFVLPILQALMEKPQSMFGLILAPTRELAYQISQQVEALGSLINVKCVVLVGGMDMVSQSIALGKKPHIVVATPGRLLDHLENSKRVPTHSFVDDANAMSS